MHVFVTYVGEPSAASSHQATHFTEESIYVTEEANTMPGAGSDMPQGKKKKKQKCLRANNRNVPHGLGDIQQKLGNVRDDSAPLEDHEPSSLPEGITLERVSEYGVLHSNYFANVVNLAEEIIQVSNITR